jgi:hypothetical protein
LQLPWIDGGLCIRFRGSGGLFGSFGLIFSAFLSLKVALFTWC